MLSPASTFVTLICVACPCFGAFVQPFWNSTNYDAGFYGGYPYQSYVSFPHVSPWLNIRQWSDQCEDGLVTMTPRGPSVPELGPVIIDPRGNLIWMNTTFGETHNFQIQSYKGKRYLTFWAGVNNGTHGRGYYYMLDQHYQVAHVVQPQGSLTGDLHEFKITDNGTALITMYETVPADLSAFGIASDGWIVDSLFQEVDIESGKALFEWRARDHYKISDTYAPIDGTGKSVSDGFDYFHINSIDKDNEGKYYISSRYMCTITCISPEDGSIIWRLGGRKSSFHDLSNGAASNFTWQHHMSVYPSSSKNKDNSLITIFDNGAYNHYPSSTYQSRALSIHLDTRPQEMTAKLLHAYTSPMRILSQSQGSVQTLPPPKDGSKGNILVGWGHSGAYTEFSSGGKVLCHVHFGPLSLNWFGWAKSYRIYKYFEPWVGLPLIKPDIAMKPGDLDHVYASWNGATEVRMWKLQGATHVSFQKGKATSMWIDLAQRKKEGFEIAFELAAIEDTHRKLHHDQDGSFNFLRVLAIGENEDIQGTTKVLDRRNGVVMPDTLEQHLKAPMAPFILLIFACVVCSGIMVFWQCVGAQKKGSIELSNLFVKSKVLVDRLVQFNH